MVDKLLDFVFAVLIAWLVLHSMVGRLAFIVPVGVILLALL